MASKMRWNAPLLPSKDPMVGMHFNQAQVLTTSPTVGVRQRPGNRRSHKATLHQQRGFSRGPFCTNQGSPMGVLLEKKMMALVNGVKSI